MIGNLSGTQYSLSEMSRSYEILTKQLSELNKREDTNAGVLFRCQLEILSRSGSKS